MWLNAGLVGIGPPDGANECVVEIQEGQVNINANGYVLIDAAEIDMGKQYNGFDYAFHYSQAENAWDIEPRFRLYNDGYIFGDNLGRTTSDYHNRPQLILSKHDDFADFEGGNSSTRLGNYLSIGVPLDDTATPVWDMSNAAMTFGVANAPTLTAYIQSPYRLDLRANGGVFINNVEVTNGTVRSVAISNSTNLTVTGGPITTTGTFTMDLSNTGVTSGTYSHPTLVVDSKGRITTITNGLVTSGTVTSIAIANGSTALTVSGSPITSSGTITLDLSNVGTAGTYTKVTTDAKGRVTAGTQLSSTDVSNALGYVPGVGANSVTTLTGDVTGTAVANTINTTLSATGVSAGTYTKITVDAKRTSNGWYPIGEYGRDHRIGI